MQPPKVTGFKLRWTPAGFKVGVTIEVDGRRYPIDVPEQYTETDDVRRELRNGMKAVRNLWQRIWRKID